LKNNNYARLLECAKLVQSGLGLDEFIIKTKSLPKVTLTVNYNGGVIEYVCEVMEDASEPVKKKKGNIKLTVDSSDKICFKLNGELMAADEVSVTPLEWVVFPKMED
jgi:hypothetical protein